MSKEATMNQSLTTGDELAAADGSAVSIRPGSTGETLETRDRSGQLLFEYQPATGRAIVHLPGLGLEFRSVDGRLELVCDRPLTIRSEGTVEIQGERGTNLSCGPSSLRVGPEALELDAPVARVRVDEARVACGKVEQSLGRVITWAKQVYERVEELLHVRAGRIRTEAEQGHLIQASQARVQAEGDVHVQGRTINLG
jgi:hypothetical protein